MATRLKFENSNEIGCFMKLMSNYCLVCDGGSETFYSIVEKEINKRIPVINCSIGGSKIIGRMCVGNKNGLLLPKDTTDDEIKDI